MFASPGSTFDCMRQKRSLDQHVAVFGESGSGKTVLVSSFYGATQDPKFRQEGLYRVVAENIGHGHRLLRNFLGMRDSGRTPVPTKVSATQYEFHVKVDDGTLSRTERNRRFDSIRLVWHDYPGEWFEQTVSGEEEKRRTETFRSLLSSDVALFLVDGHLLREHAGEETRYLKALFSGFRNGLEALKPELLPDGKRLIRFPRIWVMALSKADLLPDLDVNDFRDLLVVNAADEMDELRKVLAGFVEAEEALSVGEDFLMLSSAKFDPDTIEVAERIGLDLVLPLATTLPLERHVRWAQTEKLPADVGKFLLGDGSSDAPGIAAIAQLLMLIPVNLPGPLRLLRSVVAPLISRDLVERAAQLAGEKLEEAHRRALEKRDLLAAVLTGFRMDLKQGESDAVLLRSDR